MCGERIFIDIAVAPSTHQFSSGFASKLTGVCNGCGGLAVTPDSYKAAVSHSLHSLAIKKDGYSASCAPGWLAVLPCTSEFSIGHVVDIRGGSAVIKITQASQSHQLRRASSRVIRGLGSKSACLMARPGV